MAVTFAGGIMPVTIVFLLWNLAAYGWKVRSWWTICSTRTMFHREGDRTNRLRVVRFRLPPD